MGISSNDGGSWTVYSPPRQPESPLEVAVLETSKTRGQQSVGTSTVNFVIEDSSASYVYVVDSLEGADRYAEREVTRFRLVDGKIAAKTGKTTEIFPDAAFERAVLEIASRAAEENVMMNYRDDS